MSAFVSRRRSTTGSALGAPVAALALVACGAASGDGRSPASDVTPATPSGSAASETTTQSGQSGQSRQSGSSGQSESVDPTSSGEAAEAAEDEVADDEQQAAEAGPTGPTPSDGTPADARLAIPQLGLRDVEVVAYRGRTDDAEGTRIQNEGVAASPHGARGGTGPGGVGNYQVTAHRLSSGGIFRYLPDLERGDRVRVSAGGRTYVYEIRRTRITSFRQPASLRAQRAAVPGRPGVEATRAMITLSTCRTLEDHAEGNYWSDEFDNPENRIDKIGVLVADRPA